jgi:high-affinity iron transporter
MFTTAIIAFREFLEAFLIVGVFLGVSRKMGLKKEKEILLAALVGIGAAFVMSITTYILGDAAKVIMTHDRSELLENYIRLFSGFFLVYVIFSLHNRISTDKREIISKTKNKLENRAFDLSLFATITFLVAREGFEIALFTASTSLFYVFFQNIVGLLFGFVIAAMLGTAVFYAYVKFPIKKVFRITEYMIILLGASLVQVGITELLERQFNFHLADFASFQMQFLPDENSVFGHALQSFFGIDKEFSLPRLGIMAMYIGVIYAIVLFRKYRQRTKLLKHHEK